MLAKIKLPGPKLRAIWTSAKSAPPSDKMCEAEFAKALQLAAEAGGVPIVV